MKDSQAITRGMICPSGTPPVRRAAATASYMAWVAGAPATGSVAITGMRGVCRANTSR